MVCYENDSEINDVTYPHVPTVASTQGSVQYWHDRWEEQKKKSLEANRC